LVLELRKDKQFRVDLCVTGQHREMLDQVLEVFNIKPNVDLNLMKTNQTLANLTADAINAINAYLLKTKPDLVFVQGDTTTTFAAAIAAFYNKIKIAHVEAGLRTYEKLAPFPEEINRVLTTHIADFHFAPTKIAAKNLLSEGIPKDRVFVTGNTVIDALFYVRDKVLKNPPFIDQLEEGIQRGSAPLVLITGHRRENFGEGFENICNAIAELATQFNDHYFIYPVHLNPNVRKTVKSILKGRKNILLIEPLSYTQFIYLMTKAKIILTDSGGIQEEAPSLGKPVLVMRDITERPEAVEAGCVELVGTDKNLIIEKVKSLLLDENYYKKMQMVINPYGEGLASKFIVEAIKNLKY
jgi:UDP-N-acetylglucosamine 2-epimerase (non-hydrolysing)